MEIRLRSTVQTDIGVWNALRQYSSVLPSSVRSDCEKLQVLRNSAQSAQLADLVDYYSAVAALAEKVEVDTKFAWSNSLGHSRAIVLGSGLWFETLNVAFNVAAKITYMSSADFLKAAAVFRKARVSILPRVRDPPEELRSDALLFLERLCAARHADISGCLWQAAHLYSQLEPPVGSAFREVHERAAKLKADALLAAGQDLRLSRKRADQCQARAALVACLDGPHAEAAQALLAEPISRRSTQKLADLPAEEFDTSYFPSQEIAIPEWSPAESSLFRELLPMPWIPVPTILRLQMTKFVHAQVGDALLAQNHRVRSAAVEFNLPAGVELAQDPGRVPQSLLGMVGPNVDQFKRRLHESSTEDVRNRELLDSISSRLASIEYLLDVLQAESTVASFLGFTSQKPPAKSQPIFLSRVRESWHRMQEAMEARLALRRSALAKLDTLDYVPVNTDGDVSLAYENMFTSLTSQFEPELAAVMDFEKKAEKQERLLAQFAAQTRKSVLDNKDRERMAMALFAAAALFVDLQNDFEKYERNDAALALIPSPQQQPTSNVLRERTQNFVPQVWTPGTAINISTLNYACVPCSASESQRHHLP